MKYLRKLVDCDLETDETKRQNALDNSIHYSYLKNIRPEVNTMKMEDYVDECRKMLYQNKMKLRKLKEDGLADDIVDKKEEELMYI